MVIFDGSPLSDDIWNNRAFLFGDGIFETMKIVDGRVLFLEDHYFRLMSSMRVLRMEIPMSFTMEYFEEQSLLAAKINNCKHSGRVRFTVFRKGSGRYFPDDRDVSWHISAQELPHQEYGINHSECEADLFKDFFVPAHLLSTLKTTNRIVNILSGIYADENGLQNCLLINEHKNVVEAINGNIFLLTKNQLVTPPVSEGCLNGIMRRQILASATNLENVEVVERAVSPFEIQKADELWVTNVINGIIPLTRYRKKDFVSDRATEMVKLINALAGL